MKLARWAAMNGAFLALVIAAMSGVMGATYLMTFLIWVWFALLLLVAIVGQKIEITPSVPRQVDAGYDLLITCILAWNAHWFLAVIYLFTMLLAASITTFKAE